MNRPLIALVVLAGTAAGLVVGWLVLGDGGVEAGSIDGLVAAGTLATAVATVGLGGATVFLGVKTRDVVDATNAEAEAAREELAVAREQAKIASDALDSQTQPFLTVGDTSSRSLNGRSVHVRNVGNGTAIVTTAVFIYDGRRISAAAVDPAMPAGESTTIRLPAPPTFEISNNFSVAVAFADVSGRQRGAVRLDVYERREEGGYDPESSWWVRQVFWADTLDEVIDRPRLGSQPVD